MSKKKYHHPIEIIVSVTICVIFSILCIAYGCYRHLRKQPHESQELEESQESPYITYSKEQIDSLDEEHPQDLKYTISSTIPSQEQSQVLIQKMEWGKVWTDDSGVNQDILLTPDGVIRWNWDTDDTHHNTGVSPAVFNDTLSKQLPIDYLILSTGWKGELYISQELRTYLKKLRSEKLISKLVIRDSGAAAKLYNDYVSQGFRVMLFLHTTC